MPRRTTFVVNPVAGRGRRGARWAALEPRVRAAFPEADVQWTRYAGDAARIAADAARAGQDLVVAVGGDGTVHEVANGLLAARATHDGDAAGGAGDDPVLGLLPCGSGGDFARGQGIPLDPERAIGVLREQPPRPLDAGRIACRTLDGDGEVVRHFLNVASVGVSAAVVERLSRRARRGRRSPRSYLWIAAGALLRWRNPEVEMRADDGAPWRVRIKAVALANSPYFGGGMCVAPGARADDGVLDLTVFGDLGRLDAVRRLGETFQGRRIEHPHISYGRCRALEARAARELLLEADGELVGRLPARIEVLPGALRFVMPPAPPSAAGDAGQAAHT